MERKKVLGFWDLFLFAFCAIFGVEAIATAAAIGPSAISWWIIFIVGYFFPSGLISAELGSAYPEQGGMYAWVKRAFGRSWAARSTWYYWISLPIWAPAIYIAFAEILGQMFFPGLTFFTQVLIGVVLIWITVGINLFSLKASKWVNNIGSISKLIIIAAMVVAALMFILKNGRIANDINLSNIWPNLNIAMIFVPIIIYNLLGCELISSSAGEMKNPARDVPKAVIFSAIAIAALYLIATLLIWIVVPVSDISVSSGIIQMFVLAFGSSWLGQSTTIFIGLLVVSTLFTGVVAWTLGQNRSIAEAANSGDMPSLFGLLSRSGAPIGAALASGIISTITIVAYWFLADNAAEMFWYVTSFCLVLELLAYLFLFPAFVALRLRDKNVSRPYRVPGPNWFAFLLAVVAETFLVLTILLLCIQPGKEFIWAALPIIVGSIFIILIGEAIINCSTKSKNLPSS